MGRWLLQKWGGGYTNLSKKEKEAYRVTLYIKSCSLVMLLIIVARYKPEDEQGKSKHFGSSATVGSCI